MDAVHIPPWDSNSGAYEEYPTIASSRPSKADKGAGKGEKTQRKEQQRLQAMINGVVRLSPLPAARAAGGLTSDCRSTLPRHSWITSLRSRPAGK